MTNENKLSIKFYFPLPSDGKGVSYTCLTIASEMAALGHNISITTPRVQGRALKYNINYIAGVPKLISLLPYRYFMGVFRYFTENEFLSKIHKGDIVYLWSDISLDFIKALKNKGVIILREKFNCHVGFVKKILDQEYKKLNIKPDHGITEERVEEEKKSLEMVDFVFTASPEQKKTLIDYGVNENKIINSSYGWEKGRFSNVDAIFPNNIETTFIFVGSGIVRKGLHLLLEAWIRSNVKGKLIIAGGISNEIKNRYKNILKQDNIVCYNYIDDIGRLYKSADVFVFPTIEEGSPLVTYEAMANSLAVIVSPMGAGPIARHNIDGFIIDPHDSEGWVNAFKKLSLERELLSDFKSNALERAMDFTWDKVARQRIEEIIKRI